MNAAELKRRLCDQIEAVCRHLLPGGRQQGLEWVVGNIAGEPGDSLKVHLGASRAGLWADFANAGESGDVLDLWCRVRRTDLPAALGDICRWLGLPDGNERQFSRPRPSKPYQPPQQGGIHELNAEGSAYAYLTQTRRLYPEILARYKVAQIDHSTHGPTVVFPVYEPAGKEVELVKYLAVRRSAEGKKTVWSSADSRDHLFGWQAIPANARSLVITEGEIDTLTVAGWGFPAVSIPRGVKSFEWLENDFDALERFEKIYVCTDNDAPGRECAEQIAVRLGRERCYRVVLPGDAKDANEAHVSGKFLDADFDDAISRAATLDPPELRGAGEYGDEVAGIFWPTNPRLVGTVPPIPLPWRCRPGELSIWTGFSGHGKSLLLNQFALHDAWQGERICIASFEIPPAKTLAILCRMVLGCEPRSRVDAEKALAWLDGKFWFLDHRGPQPWPKFLPVLEYAARRYGCTRFVIDSLLFCGLASDDYAAQKEFMCELVRFAAESVAHIHLVAHSRKKEDESHSPGKLDVKGAGDLTDIAHNGFTVWRNKAKEAKFEELTMTKAHPAAIVSAGQLRDGQLAMWKNRETGEEPFRNLWLHKPSHQFVSAPDGRPFPYFPVADRPLSVAPSLTA